MDTRSIRSRGHVDAVLSKNPIDAVRRADSTLDARRVATFVTAESLCSARPVCRLSVSNSSSGRRWKLDHAPAVGDPTHMVEFGTGRRAFAREA